MDLSKLSDAELEAIAGGGGGSASPFSGMSDEELARIAGEPAPAPAAAAPTAEAPSMLSTLGSAYGRLQGLAYRAGVTGALGGLAAPASLTADAGINLAYGAKKLASKTGLVEAPDPANYYKVPDTYFPATTAIGNTLQRGADAVGLPKPETAPERMGSAVVSAASGAVSGVGAGNIIAQGGSALAKRVGGFLSAQPNVQMASGAASGAAAQGVTELGGNETAATAAGFLAGVGTGAAGARIARPARAPVPTTTDLENAKTAAYARSEAAGVRFDPAAVGAVDAQTRAALPHQGVYLDLDPAARRVMEGVSRSHLPDAAGNRRPVTLERLDAVRQEAGKAARSSDPKERRTGAILARHMDDFLDTVTPSEVVAGNATEGIAALREGQAANRRFAKASALDTALDKAELRANSTGTGSNGENTVRQNLRRIIEDPDSADFRQFSPEERAAMRRIVEGDRTGNLLRLLGRAAPTGTVSGIAALGATSMGLGAIPAAGIAARAYGARRFNRQVGDLERLVKGGPAALERPSANYLGNTSRGAAHGFLGAAYGERERRGRYR